MNNEQNLDEKKDVNLELPEHRVNAELSSNDFGLLYALFMRFGVDITLYINPFEEKDKGFSLKYKETEGIGILEEGLTLNAAFDEYGRAEYIKIVKELDLEKENEAESEEKEENETQK